MKGYIQVDSNCVVTVEVSDCTTKTEAEQTAVNLAGVKARVGGFSTPDDVELEYCDSYQENGVDRWRAKASVGGTRS